MNESLPLYVAGAAALAALLPRLHRRLQLSRAKHRSLAGHSKMSRRVAKLLPFYEFDETGVYVADGAPDDVAARRRNGFEALAARLGAQYAQYEPVPGMFIKPELTMGENIADLGGILLALDAYRASLKGAPAPTVEGLTGELCVRTLQAGDRFHALGAPGSRPLTRFLADAGVPREERPRVPLVFAGDELVWVAGIRPCESRRVDARTTRRLRLRLEGAARPAPGRTQEAGPLF